MLNTSPERQSPARCKCGASLAGACFFPVRCRCGKVYLEGAIELAPHRRCAVRPNGNSAICRRGECDHYNAAGDTCGLTITIGRAKGQKRAGKVGWLDSHPTHPCPEDPGRFDPSKGFRGGVGFLFVSHTRLGGTEVWARTLIPRLPDVAGFAVWEPIHASGDMSLLGCPYGVGPGAARKLAEACDTLVVWGLGAKLGEVFAGMPRRPRVISMTHGDGSSEWSTKLLRDQQPWTDRYVYLCDSARASVPEAMRSNAVLIPNAPDPARVVPARSREAARKALGIGPDERLLVGVSRYSPEKRIHLLMEAAAMLPTEYRLLVAGGTGGWNDHYGERLRTLTTDRVRLIPPVDPPADLFAAADAYVSASEQEGYGLSTAEAMLAGVPVMATPTGFLEREPELAAIVPHDATPAIWAAAIEADFADAAGQRARAAAAKRAVGAGHSVDRFVEAWNAVTTVRL